MRNEFIETLTELAGRDDRLVLLTGDLGFSVLEPFATRFPDRFYNCGVAEQNMTGVATGLAEAGMIPFTYSIATFATLRPYEFIRNGPIVHQLPVRIVGIGGGFDYGSNGITHYALEDVGVLRLQDRLMVVVPADGTQAQEALLATYDAPGPVYYRLSKSASPIPALGDRYEPGALAILRNGENLALIAMGPIVGEALEAAERLVVEGIDAAVALVSSFNPAPEQELAELLSAVPLAVTVESHYVRGGLGSLAAEVIAERGLGTRLHRCGVAGLPSGVTGPQKYLEHRHGISADGIVRAVRRAVRRVW